MHEIGALYHAVKSVEKIANENNVPKVKSVTLDIGELSGMLPYFLESYFPVVTHDLPMFEDCKLILNTVPGEAICNDCKSMFNVVKHEGECPNCHSRDKNILSGQEMVIKEIGV